MSISSQAPMSFVDDGGPDFEERMPAHSTYNDIRRWAESIMDETASMRSYVDDGADLHQPEGNVPRFGAVNQQYYSNPNPRPSRDYHPAVVRAVSMSIYNNLRYYDEIWRRVEPLLALNNQWGVSQDAGVDPPPGYVRIPLPYEPPTFVIYGEDGHVVVVDGPGPVIDSRPPPELRSWAPQQLATQQLAPQTMAQQSESQAEGKQTSARKRRKGKEKRGKREKQKEWTEDPVPVEGGDFLTAGGLENPSLANSDDSWERDLKVVMTYQAPTVETLPGTPDEHWKQNSIAGNEDGGSNGNWGGNYDI
ncbi:hypothetical protein CC78DRAFT_612406 [Lojkania enalia]|uniref:Uncharacterized protein n=1 Tax=Lojkania enalia TaxID=147567 RepID=A0A9P4NA57_9PLEO|nr:hypothetical protein CC78DRAFT_612406 [Didymosphaeria enalia]